MEANRNVSESVLGQAFNRVNVLISRITLQVMDKSLTVKACFDKKYGQRIYLQVHYDAACKKSREFKSWSGRKWYLSEYMTDDEIVKTCYLAFETAVKHEIMEGFKVDNIAVFNPHTNYEILQSVSGIEMERRKPEYYIDAYL